MKKLTAKDYASMVPGELNCTPQQIITICKIGLNTSAVSVFLSYFFYRVSTPYTPPVEPNEKTI